MTVEQVRYLHPAKVRNITKYIQISPRRISDICFHQTYIYIYTNLYMISINWYQILAIANHIWISSALQSVAACCLVQSRWSRKIWWLVCFLPAWFKFMSGWWLGTFFRGLGIPPTRFFCQVMSEFWTSIFLIEDAQGDWHWNCVSQGKPWAPVIFHPCSMM
jgi:hypothetical protein